MRLAGERHGDDGGWTDFVIAEEGSLYELMKKAVKPVIDALDGLVVAEGRFDWPKWLDGDVSCRRGIYKGQA